MRLRITLTASSDTERARATRQPASFVHAEVPLGSSTPSSSAAAVTINSLVPGEPSSSTTEGTKASEQAQVSEPLVLPTGCYKALPPVVSLKRTEEHGRGLYANVDIPAGSVCACTYRGGRLIVLRKRRHLGQTPLTRPFERLSRTPVLNML